MSERAIVNIIDNLDSTSTTDALSANQGRVLKGMIGSASSVSVINNLTSTSQTAALSANQGRVLKGLIDNIGSNVTKLTGTSSKPIVLNTLSTGVYIVTGYYKATSTSTASNTKEHIIASVLNRGDNTMCYTLITPTAVFRRVDIENNAIINNDLFRILNGEFLYNGKPISCSDTGWNDNITLYSGISKHNATSFPVRCKKQGNIVYIEGAIKGVTTKQKEIGVLPAGYRPSKVQYFIQARSGGKIDTFMISTNGVIEIMNSTADTFNASDYHFISTSFMI